MEMERSGEVVRGENMSKQATAAKDKATRLASKEADYGRFDFVKLAFPIGMASLILTVLSIVLILTKGLNYGIDFAGGTEIQVKFPQAVEMDQLRKTIEQAGIAGPAVQGLGTDSLEYLVRLEIPKGAATEKETNELITKQVTTIREALKSRHGLQDDGILRVDTVGPAVGSELKRNGLLAAFYSFILILIYVGIRFDYKYAPGAVICLIHDSVVTMGVFALLGREFNIQIMASILTLIGYSLNDTIVTFDRIRETAPQNREMSMKFIINKSINDMLGRTILTAGTTMIAVLALFYFGGGVISEIAFTLIIGIIAGTYSSIYVAAPLVLVMEKFKKSAA